MHDHPDIKCTVTIEWCGPEDQRPHVIRGRDLNARHPLSDEELLQDHDVIYCDGYIAVTTYECCYAMFELKEGFVSNSYLWRQRNWKIRNSDLLDLKNKFPGEHESLNQ